MNLDWKDALSRLQQSGNIPEAPQTEEAEAPAAPATPARADTLIIGIDRRNRRGKTATIIEGFSCPDEEVSAIAGRLKAALGTGGSARGGEILLQGDWRDRAADWLRANGFKTKRGN